MTQRICNLLTLVLLLGQLGRGFAQETDFLSQEYFISKVIRDSYGYGLAHPTEKIYIHFDRPFYLVSDTAWFNIYVVDAKLEPTLNSVVVFVDWIHQDGTLKKHQQFQIVKGKAAGSLAFAEYPEGIYSIRAYTKLMANLDPDYLYYKRLELINPSGPATSQTVSTSIAGDSDLQFFPEGGYLVNGLESQVAFKAIDSHGNGVDVTAELLNDLNRPIRAVKSDHKGMGVFTLKPTKGKSYQVLWNNKNYSLPKALDNGVVMGVEMKDPDSIHVRIQASGDLLPGRFYLIGQSGGNICFRDMFTMSDPTMVLQIAKRSFPSGISQLTLFDDNSTPKCERMFFPNQDIGFQVTTRFNKEQYGPRELVEMNIVVADDHGKPVQAEISVAITDAAFGRRNVMNENIQTQLLLQSDLRGKIEDPAWYFGTVDGEKIHGLDLVMLTHGWRKFIWNEVFTENDSIHAYVSEEGLSIHGQVINLKTSKVIPFADITLLTNNTGTFFTATANAQGNFSIDNLMFDDSTRFVWQIRDKKGAPIEAKIEFMTPEMLPIDSSRFFGLTFRERKDLTDALTRINAYGIWNPAMMLKEVEIKGKKIDIEKSASIIPDDYHRLSLKPTAEESLNYTDVPTMIADKFPNVTFIGAGQNLDVRIRGFHKRLEAKNEVSPLIVLDGQIISTDSLHQGGVYSALNIIPVSQIEKIEVLTGAAAAIYGARGGSGVIAMYSKPMSGRVVIDKSGPGKGVLKIIPPGYDWPKTFYQPKYHGAMQPSSDPDHRMTLFWNPRIQTDTTGKAKIKFYNSDIAKTFQVVIEGLANSVPVFGVK